MPGENSLLSRSPEELEFLAQIRRNPFLEREETLHRVNSELERKTSDLMDQIDTYSKRSTSEEFLFACMFSSTESSESTSGSSGAREDPKSRSESTSSESLASNSMMVQFPERRRVPSRSQVSIRTSSCLSAVSSTNQLQRATESVVKCLQSKLANHEERLADIHLQYREKIQENMILEGKVRSLEEERERLLRSLGGLQSSLDRLQKNAENSKSHLASKTQILYTAKKETEELKKDLKQSQASIQSLQTRLNRALDENDKLKHQNRSLNLQVKEIQADQRGKFDDKYQIGYNSSSNTKIANSKMKKAREDRSGNVWK